MGARVGRRARALATASLTVVALVFGVVVPGGSGVAGAASGSGFVGVSSHTFWSSESDVRSELSAAAAGGVRWVREDFRWDVLEPSKGVFDWRRSDALMAGAASAGVEVLAILTYSAKWASSDPSGAQSIYFPPKVASDYGNYAAAVVRRYGPGGSFWAGRPDLPVRPLRAVELWNEPWGWWNWRSGVDPVGYAALARAGAAAVKAAQPTTTVLLAGDLLQVRTDGAVVGWLDKVLAADPGLVSLVDAYSVHPYPYPREFGPLVDRADKRWDYGRVPLIREVAAARGAAKPIWLTEVGWSTAQTSDSVTEAKQAEFVRDAVLRAARDWSYVERVFVYTWTKDRPELADREAHYGLRRTDGSYKPAWAALTAAIATLGDEPAPNLLACPLDVPFTRLGGTDRIATAVRISQADFGVADAGAVVLARSTDFPDALAGTPLAVAENGPLLLTPGAALDGRTAAELRRVLVPGATVYLLGGEAALGRAVADAVRALGFAVTRLAGRDRYETAAVVAATGLGRPGTVLLARGDDFPDALSAGAAAPAVGGAVLLTGNGTMPAATAAYLATSAPKRVYAVGAGAARAAVTATPLVGQDRYDTARTVASRLLGLPTSVAMASGTGFADALAGGAHAARNRAQLLLTARDELPSAVADHLADHATAITKGYLYGGSAAIAGQLASCR